MANFNLIDWQQLLDDLEWDTEDRKSELIRARLRQRAQQYALQADSVELEDEADHTILVFDLGSERYGVDVMLVRNVRAISRITPVPGTPAFYPGVVNIRGKILTVLDLRLFFGVEVKEAEPPRELIVVNVNALEIGVLAHHVSEVQTVYRSMLESLDDMRYARGMAPNRVTFLDFSRLFEDERLLVGGNNG
jgi:purine-binding chemotaxis protein CheW